MKETTLLEALVTHQVNRLRDTYSDFIADEWYQQLALFFFNRLYSSEGKEERDASFAELYDSFRSKLGDNIASNLRKLMEVNKLSDELDEEVAALLAKKVGSRNTFTNEQYEEAYYEADRYGERVEQIELLCETMTFFHQLANRRGTGLILKILKCAARLKGAKHFAQFLQDGFRAFRSVPDIIFFREALRTRELKRLDRIYGKNDKNGTRRRLARAST